MRSLIASLILPILLNGLLIAQAHDSRIDDAPMCSPDMDAVEVMRQGQLLYSADKDAFERESPSDVEVEQNVYLVDTVTGEQQTIAEGFGYAVWSGDGQRLALLKDGGLYLLNLKAGTAPEVIISEGSVTAGKPYHFNSVNWMSDGQEIIFGIEKPFNLKDGKPYYAEIYSVNLESKMVSQVMVEGVPNATYPVVSPDGSKIAFMVYWDELGNRINALYAMNIDGSSLRLIDEGNLYNWPDWLPNSQHVRYLAATANNAFETQIIDVDSGVKSVLTSYVINPSWSQDGSFAVFEFNYDIYRMNGDGSHICRLTDQYNYIQGVVDQFSSEVSALNPHIGGITLSPDGLTIVYDIEFDISYNNGVMPDDFVDGRPYSEVYIMRRDGANRQLLFGSWPIRSLSWRPVEDK
jgi:Tol biopolymer transport system component